MRQSFLLLISVLCSFVNAKDWIVLDIDVAKKAVTVLENQDEIIFWCDCCNQDLKEHKDVSNVFMQPYLDTSFFTISIMDVEGSVYNQIDLSQIFINYKSKAVNLANYLKLSPVKLCHYGNDFYDVMDKAKFTNLEFENDVEVPDIRNNEEKEVEIVDLESYYKENSRFLSNEINFLTYDNTDYVSTKPILFEDDETLFIAKDTDGSGIFLLKKKYTDEFANNKILYDNMTLILDNGEAINLVDDNIRGRTVLNSFKIFFLDNSEMFKLKSNNIQQIIYFSTPLSHIELKQHKSHIKFAFNTRNEINYIF